MRQLNPSVERTDLTCVNFGNWNISGGSTYKSFRHRPPNRTKFFHFYICFHRKVPVSEDGAPSNEGWHPPTGNPGSAPEYHITLVDLGEPMPPHPQMVPILSFRHTISVKNPPVSEVGAHLPTGSAPPTGNLGSATVFKK